MRVDRVSAPGVCDDTGVREVEERRHHSKGHQMRYEALARGRRILDRCSPMQEVAVPDKHVTLLGHEGLDIKPTFIAQASLRRDDLVGGSMIAVMALVGSMVQLFEHSVAARDVLELSRARLHIFE